MRRFAAKPSGTHSSSPATRCCSATPSCSRRSAGAASVLDEAQNIKNPESKQARAARALDAGYRIALTGTPVENHVGDLWSIMEFLNPGLLGSQAAFNREFLHPDSGAARSRRSRAAQAPYRPVRPAPPQERQRVIADLPEKNEMKVFCTLTREQASLYAAVVRDLEPSVDESEGIERRGMSSPRSRSSSRSATIRRSSPKTTRRSPAAPESWRGWTKCSRRCSTSATAR